MTPSEWLAQANLHSADLISLIGEYHPSSHHPRHDLEITAPFAEQICESTRQSIKSADPSDPVQRFKVALATGSIGQISQAVDLMDDPPERPKDEDSQAPTNPSPLGPLDYHDTPIEAIPNV